MNKNRRNFLSRLAGLGLTSLLVPLHAWAAWPKNLFSITKPADALSALTGGKTVQRQGVELTVPSIAENGAQVRVEVKTTLANVEKIFVLAEKNPVPLIAQFNISPNRVADVAVNIKLSGTSNISALVQTQSGFFDASEEVSVTAGGCG
ncbi:MAG: thiosulfate oxidation carrier protein SoxY [Candidatus Oxydemutatoraceae bacterium WSBS_2016_MAG_OTU14]